MRTRFANKKWDVFNAPNFTYSVTKLQPHPPSWVTSFMNVARCLCVASHFQPILQASQNFNEPDLESPSWTKRAGTVCLDWEVHPFKIRSRKAERTRSRGWRTTMKVKKSPDSKTSWTFWMLWADILYMTLKQRNFLTDCIFYQTWG